MYNIKTITQSEQNRITVDDYFIKLKENIELFENYYHLFYSSYSNSKMSLSYLGKKFDFIKAKIDWEEKIYESNYLDEVYTVIFYLNQASNENDRIEDIETDINMVMFNKYQLKIEQKILTNDGKVLFFLKNNYLNNFEEIFYFFQNHSVSTFENYYNSSSTKYVLVEVAGLITYIAFFIFVFIFLHMNDQLIFKYILSMFLTSSNFNNVEKISLKNHKDNIFLRQKCKCFRLLLESFQFESLHKFETIKSITHSTTLGHESFYNNANTNYENRTNSNGPNDTSLNGSSLNNNTNNVLLVPCKSSQMKVIQKEKLQNVNPNFYMFKSPTTNQDLSRMQTNKSIKSTTQNLKTNSVTNNENPNTLTITRLVELTHNPGIFLIKILAGLTFASFLLIFMFFYLKTYFSLSFLIDIKNIFEGFIVFKDKYSYLYLYFIALRELLISTYSESGIQTFESIQTKLEKNLEQNKLIDLSQFKNTYNLSLICNSENIDYNNITSNFMANGINTASNAIRMSVQKIYYDYLEKKNNINSNDDIINFLSNNEERRTVTLIEISLNYIYKEIQKYIYSAYTSDAENIRKSFRVKVDVFNIICLLYCCIIFIVVIFNVVINLKKKVIFVKAASNKFGKTVKHWIRNGRGIYGIRGEDTDSISKMFFTSNTGDSNDLSVSFHK